MEVSAFADNCVPLCVNQLFVFKYFHIYGNPFSKSFCCQNRPISKFGFQKNSFLRILCLLCAHPQKYDYGYGTSRGCGYSHILGMLVRPANIATEGRGKKALFTPPPRAFHSILAKIAPARIQKQSL